MGLCWQMNFWLRLETGDSNKISVTIFKLIKKMHNSQIFSSKWCTKIVQTLNNLGMSYAWLANELRLNQLKTLIHQRLNDISLQSWSSNTTENRLCWNYRLYKTEPKYEKQLNVLDRDLMIPIIKFRCGTHHLPISVKRYEELGPENMCPFGCDELGDEYHYLLCCPAFTHYRVIYIDKYYFTRPNVIKFGKLMNVKSKLKLSKLAKFVKVVLHVFRK